jgi:hypothetical protein
MSDFTLPQSAERLKTIRSLSEYIKTTSICVKIEKSCYNSTIDYCRENNIYCTWSTENFKMCYNTTVYNILYNIQIIIDGIDDINLDTIGYWNIINIKAMSDEKNTIDIRNNQVVEKKYSKTVKCRYCNMMTLSLSESQTRSSDEAPTIKYSCDSCNKSWTVR